MCIKKLRRHLCKYFLVLSCIIISLFVFFNTKNNVTNGDWLSWIRKFALPRFVARRPVHLRLLEDPYINSSGLSINCTALGRHNTTEIARFSFSIILFSLQNFANCFDWMVQSYCRPRSISRTIQWIQEMDCEPRPYQGPRSLKSIVTFSILFLVQFRVGVNEP